MGLNYRLNNLIITNLIAKPNAPKLKTIKASYSDKKGDNLLKKKKTIGFNLMDF